MEFVILGTGIIFSICAWIVILFHKRKKAKHEAIVKKELTIGIYQNMTFSEFMTPSIASEKALAFTNCYLSSTYGEVARLSLDAFRGISEGQYYRATFTDAISKRISEGSAQLMKNKLIAVDSKTKKIIGNPTEISKGMTDASQVASVMNVAIGAAHILSGYDNAKKLNSLTKDVTKILSFRSCDMLGELEAIFECFQEINIEKLSEDRVFLNQLKLRTKTLRNQWFSEAISALENIEDPNKRGFFAKLFSTRKGTLKKYESEEKIALAPLHITRSALELERAICFLLGEDASFVNQTLMSQREKIERLQVLLIEKREAITIYTEVPLEQVEAMTQETKKYLSSLNFEQSGLEGKSKQLKKVS
ncbi:hypothetical protein [Peredibacter starrii]|uniref:Uncharacterized protein n=1 Tax=Peredibacter starrii TaxID=28202 RepID=A0AAX4HRC6_9BACT|nr:hypothetical protein [Peredibacter starrii]WPU65899.1 hypothetical protein SOO65_03990 [Peredibacter starrii]